MSRTMPDTETIPFGQTMGAKAAGFALALAGSLLLAAFLIATLPGKYAGWENALPTASMSEAEAEAALMRAKYLHEAEVRPQLIRAGIFSPDDAGGRRDRYRGHYGEEPTSEALTNALWTFRAFPELHAEFFAALLDTKTAVKKRQEDFYLYGGFIAAVANAVVDGRDSRYHAHKYGRGYSDESVDWFSYFLHDPRLKTDMANRRDFRDRKDAAAEAGLFDERLAFARAALPEILADVKKDVEARTALAAEEEKGKGSGSSRNKAWENRHDQESYLEDTNQSVADAMRILWEKRADAGFAALAREIVTSNEGSLQQRYDILPLAAQKPGLPPSEYFFWQKYKDDLASVTSCVGTTPGSYAYLLGCMDKLMTETTNQLKSRGSFILAGHAGPGVTMTRTETFTPKANLSGNLYLLADMALAMKEAPEYDLSRAHPIFRGTLYRHMENQPLVLPLNPASPKDAALIAWYAETGWTQGRTLLFSAVGSPADVARHWGLMHLLWWEDGNAKKHDDPSLAYLHPESGHFMTAMLSEVKGKAVSRFLGPVTALWFGIRNVNETGWFDEKYEARPEVAPAIAAGPRKPIRSPLLDWFTGKTPEAAAKAPVRSEATATLVISGSIRSALNKTYSRNYRVTLARRLDKNWPDPAMTPQAVFNFTAQTLGELDKWGIDRGQDVSLATEYLWRFRNDEKVDKRVRGVLAQDDLRPYERMRKIRRVLGLPEKKGN